MHQIEYDATQRVSGIARIVESFFARMWRVHDYNQVYNKMKNAALWLSDKYMKEIGDRLMSASRALQVLNT